MCRSIPFALVIACASVPVLIKPGPSRFRRTLVNLLPFKKVRRLRDVVDILHNTAVEILESKRCTLQQGDEKIAMQIGRGKDLISILSMLHAAFVYSFLMLIAVFSVALVKANMEASDADKLTEEEVLGQVMLSKIFIFHTSHSILSFTTR